MVLEEAAAKKRIQLLKNLPTLPGMIEQISRAVESKRFSAADIGKLISRDQVLTAKVLKLANSAFYGYSRKVGSLTQALVLLGFDVVKGLILTSSVFDLMKTRSLDLWKHSMGVATAAGILADQIEMKGMEEVSLAGLLHDLGKVVLRVHMPDDMDSVNELVEVEGLSVRDAEVEVLGFNHTHVGLWLAESWKLPQNMTDAIRWHHQPENSRQEPLITAVVHFADILARGYGYGDGGDPWVPPLERTALKQLNLSAQSLEKTVDQLCEHLVDKDPGLD
ncbi:MAG: HDOD domain-containing protein [Desulfarculaceae bacterium]|jgi:putative nucleotidyltransferase with HDIG domain